MIKVNFLVRRVFFVVVFLCAIMVTGCNLLNKGNTPESDSLTALKDTTVENGKTFAVAYLGYNEDIDSLLESSELEKYRENYSFLWNIPKENYVINQGDEIYCIVPTDLVKSILVNEWIIEDSLSKVGKELYNSNSPSPILLKGNVSDIMPNLQVTMNIGNDKNIIFNPTVSLKDGSFLATGAENDVYDFTIYPEGFIRE